MGVGLRLVDVVEVVGHDEREAGLRRQAQELLVEARLLGDPVVLELQEEVALAEDVAVLAGQAAGRLPVVDLERLRDLAAEAGGEADEALGVAGEELAVDARLVVVAVEVGVGEEPAQVPVADEVLGQEDEVERLRVGLPLAVAHGPPGDVGLDADDRLDPLGLRGLVEGDGAVEGAVVGQGEGIEAQPLRLVDEIADPAEAVEERELGVDVEVGEVVGGERHGGSMVPAQPGQRRWRPRWSTRAGAPGPGRRGQGAGGATPAAGEPALPFADARDRAARRPGTRPLRGRPGRGDRAAARRVPRAAGDGGDRHRRRSVGRGARVDGGGRAAGPLPGRAPHGRSGPATLPFPA